MSPAVMSPRRRRRLRSELPLGRLTAGLALILAVGVIAVLIAHARSPSRGGGVSGPAPGVNVATVQRRDLSETDTESGTIGYGDPNTVFDRLNGTITWLPSVGQVIHPGGTLFTVDGQPVLLMNGRTPAYRDLDASDSDGSDILQLNRNLVRLGFEPERIIIDDVWQPATTDGVDALQASEREPETGSLPLGRVVFLAGDQLIAGVEATIGGAGSGAGAATGAAAGGAGASGASGARLSAVRAAPEFVTLKGEPSPAASQSQALAALIALLRAQGAQLKALLKAERSAGGSSPIDGAGSGDNGGSAGSDGDAAGASPILQTTSTRPVVTVDLPAGSQSEAVLGERVTVQLPAGNTVPGTVTAVSRVAQTSSGAGSGGAGGAGSGGSGGSNATSSTIPVTITLQGRHAGAGLDQAAVSVTFTQLQAEHVLSVPVTALVAVPGGRYAVQEAAAPNRLITVDTGLFAAGYVQISGPGIQPGLQVTESQG